MADIAKRLCGPVAVSTSNTVFYTVPTGVTTIVRNIHIAGASSSTTTISLAIGVTTAPNSLYWGYTVPQNSAFDWSGFLVLAAGETLQGLAGQASLLTLTVSGIEVS